jgi:hypothetical protein
LSCASHSSDHLSTPADQTASTTGTDHPTTEAARPRATSDLEGIRAVVDDTGGVPLTVTVASVGLEPDRRTGRCQCGDIAYEVTGSPIDPHLCFPDD